MRATLEANCLKCIILLTPSTLPLIERPVRLSLSHNMMAERMADFDLAKIYSAGWQPQPHPASISPCRNIIFLSDSRHALKRALPCAIAVFSLPIVPTDTPPVTSQAPKTVVFIVPSSFHCFAKQITWQKSRQDGKEIRGQCRVVKGDPSPPISRLQNDVPGL